MDSQIWWQVSLAPERLRSGDSENDDCRFFSCGQLVGLFILWISFWKVFARIIFMNRPSVTPGICKIDQPLHCNCGVLFVHVDLCGKIQTTLARIWGESFL